MNIRSIARHLPSFIDQCLGEDTKYDVMAFSETRLDNNISSLYNITGYDLYTTNRDRSGGGVCLYVSNIYNSCVLPDCSIMEPYFECVCVEVSNDKETNFIASIYRPPKGNVSDFLHALD